MSNRRDFLKKGALLTSLSLVSLPKVFASETENSTDETPAQNQGALFTLPSLPYAADALEPHIDTLTMQIHHDKHHKAYVDNLNKAAELAKLEDGNLETLMQNISKYPVAIRNNGGGHYNHSMFWKMMKPNGGGIPKGKVAAAINAAFGDYDTFKKKFSEAGMARFGSGWTWLIVQNGKLVIVSTPNQDNPLMDVVPAESKGKPVFCLDVWEHAYYLHYQNKRAGYIESFFNLINWDEVAIQLG